VRSAYSAPGKYVDRSWEHINMNAEIETEAAKNSFSGNTKMGFSLQFSSHFTALHTVYLNMPRLVQFS
jgi:hypothetical protein